MGLRSRRGRCSREKKSRALQHTATTQKSEERGGGGERVRGSDTQARCTSPTARSERRRRGEGRQSSEVREANARQRQAKGRRAARKTKARRMEDGGAAKDEARESIVHTRVYSIRGDSTIQYASRGSREEKKKEKEKYNKQEPCSRDSGLQPRGPAPR